MIGNLEYYKKLDSELKAKDIQANFTSYKRKRKLKPTISDPLKDDSHNKDSQCMSINIKQKGNFSNAGSQIFLNNDSMTAIEENSMK